MEEAHRAECIHGNVLQWPPQLNFSPWVNLTDQALSWSVYKLTCISWMEGERKAHENDNDIWRFSVLPKIM